MRVLAIDQTFREVQDEQVVVGSTATLELTLDDAELIAQADATGLISLILRGVNDLQDDLSQRSRTRPDALSNTVPGGVNVIRYGRVSNTNQQGL